jgi:hypothetical protein
MPLDLFGWDGLWDGRTEYQGQSAVFIYFICFGLFFRTVDLNPTEPVELDEADAELLFEPPLHAHVPAATNGHSLPSTPGVSSQPNVSWLRRAEYASRSMTRQGSGPEMQVNSRFSYLIQIDRLLFIGHWKRKSPLTRRCRLK